MAAIDSAKRTQIPGHLHPDATAANDQGLAESSLYFDSVTLVLLPSSEQQAALDQFLAQQQDPSSANYHYWLTPEEYAARFGVSQSDLDRITQWLQAENLKVLSRARGRNSITFSGPVRTLEIAFQTQIHRYSVNGESHYANSTEPSVPAALGSIVTAIRGLNDFRLKPFGRAQYTSGSTGTHSLAPDDIASIYNLKPLYNAGINGGGQKIAIVGQTQINLSDIQQFKLQYNLPAGDPQVILVPGLRDPGISKNDLDEAHLDIEWSGAIARNTTVVYVYSYKVDDAVRYAIDQNLAPVMSMSYGLCEAQAGKAAVTSYRQSAQQANAQGMTWIAASGDDGSAACFAGSTKNTSLSVNVPASIPEVTGIGGTTFNEGSGNYWNATNDVNLASALGYIPEVVWNDSVADGTPSASGGGPSASFAKPTWQVGHGVPSDGARDVPDISLAGSADHDPYLFFTQGKRAAVGGTSVGAPVFAGIVAVLNQYQLANGFQSTAGMGNINPQLYAMASTSPGAFHDVVNGDNVVTPCANANKCTATAIGSPAGVGYDLATGLGTVDAYGLITSWHLKGAATNAAAKLTITTSATTITSAGFVTLTAVVSGSGVPTGSVTWTSNGVSLGSAALVGSAGSIVVQGAQLVVGVNSISATYSGDGVFGSAAGSVVISVNSGAQMGISGATNAASYQQAYAPGMILAIFGSGLSGTTQSAPVVPLPTQLAGVNVTINGVFAPIYFISPTQVNVQVPYAVLAGAATVKLSYNGQPTTLPIFVQAAAPGIFTDPTTGGPVGYTAARRGETIALYVTGDGVPTPQPASGDVPGSALPIPSQSVGLTVGGAVVTQVPFIGIPSWAIGLTQINYTVPTNAPLGKQPVIVTVGGVPSGAVTLNVTQ